MGFLTPKKTGVQMIEFSIPIWKTTPDGELAWSWKATHAGRVCFKGSVSIDSWKLF